MLILVPYALLSLVGCKGDELKDRNFDFTGLTGFPKDFIFGAATASYQVEGAWNVSGKGENIWDRITHTNPSWVTNQDNGDVACDSYHKYKEDIKNIKSIGFKMYRFSLSWSRLFPTGYARIVNPDAVRYYNALIDELLSNDIEPMITLYHWDLPQPLEDIGGWLNCDIVEIFGDYARAVFKLFGDKVKWWVTINESLCVTDGYGSEAKAPSLNLHGTGDYLSGHNLLLAHAKAYRIYDQEFRQTQGGKVSIVLNGDFHFPKDPNDQSHIDAAERANQFTFGWFAHPIFSETGDYPPVMREYVDRNSKAEGKKESRLPYFTDEEIKDLKGSFDYMGLNHYTSKNAKPGLSKLIPSIQRDQNAIVTKIPGRQDSFCGWLQVVPDGYRALLNWLKREYNNPEIFLTENGFCDGGGNINDEDRVNYYSEYLKNVLAAINEDGSRILGYTIWSLMDNFEWKEGYATKFGLMKVDFDDPDRPRTLKLSGKFIKDFLQNNLENNIN